MGEYIEQFRAAIRSAGLAPPDVIESDGNLHRFASDGTVSELKRKGLDITSTLIHLPGYSRAGAYVVLYALTETSRQRALQLIGATR